LVVVDATTPAVRSAELVLGAAPGFRMSVKRLLRPWLPKILSGARARGRGILELHEYMLSRTAS